MVIGFDSAAMSSSSNICVTAAHICPREGEPGTVVGIMSAALGGRRMLMGCQHNAVANVGEADLRWPRW